MRRGIADRMNRRLGLKRSWRNWAVRDLLFQIALHVRDNIRCRFHCEAVFIFEIRSMHVSNSGWTVGGSFHKVKEVVWQRLGFLQFALGNEKTVAFGISLGQSRLIRDVPKDCE